MLGSFIKLIMQNVPFIMLATSILIGAVIGLAARSKKVMVESMIRYMMLLSIGAVGLWAFLMHVVFSGTAATFIGWQPSPFQFEVGVANLGLGLAGLLGFRKGYDYWLAIAIISATFLWGAALGHLYQMIIHGNFAPGNAGMIFYTDILRPLFLNYLLYLDYRLNRK